MRGFGNRWTPTENHNYSIPSGPTTKRLGKIGNVNIYKDKKILVTGHTGFKGAWLTVMLQSLGAEVFGLSKDIGQKRPDVKSDLAAENEFEVDIRDRSTLSKAVKDVSPDLVFHLAAQSLVLESYRDPLSTFEINFGGTLNILEVCSNLPSMSGVVVTTTDKVYKNTELNRRFKEDDELGGLDPYSASKSSASILIKSWRDIPTFQGMQFVDVRAGNVIGGGDRAIDRLMPDLIQGAISKQPIVIRNPESVRPWQHVLDPLMGYLKVGQSILQEKKLKPSYNFGPSSHNPVRVRDLAQIFMKHFPDLNVSFASSENESKESKLLQLDSDLALTEFGWSSQISTEEAINMTILWEKAVQNCELSSLEATKGQIQQVLELKDF